MPGGATQINQSPLCQQNDIVSIGESIFVHLRFDFQFFDARKVVQSFHLNFDIEMAYVADDSVIFHGFHMFDTDDVATSCCGYENISFFDCFFHCSDFVAFHSRLQGTDGVYFRDDYPSAEIFH